MNPTTMNRSWLGIGATMPPNQGQMVPIKAGGGGVPPGIGGDQGGGGGNNGGASSECGCHPLWYLGSAIAAALLLTLLLGKTG